jgi:hypothetical protein
MSEKAVADASHNPYTPEENPYFEEWSVMNLANGPLAQNDIRPFVSSPEASEEDSSPEQAKS